jgi:hypothetical protein
MESAVEPENILVVLSPPEFYIWGWLSGLALDRGSRKIELLKPSPPFYSNRHLKRILKSLQEKRFLVIITTPKNQNEPLVLWLGSQVLIGSRSDTGDQAVGHRRPGEGEKGVESGPGRTPATRQENGENAGRVGARGWRSDTGDQADPQLSLALKTEIKLEAWVRMEQGQLLRRIRQMDWITQGEILEKVGQVAPIARAGSKQAKIFAAIRFLQERGTVLHPRAFVEALAKRTEAQLRGGNGKGPDPQTVASYHPERVKGGVKSF